MRMNNRQHQPLQLRGEDLVETDRYMFLGRVVNIDGGADEDVKIQINKARIAFNILHPIWNSKA
ncbi:hypothetical protein DPMN_004765 [Dreissena polymorpha]|uniref:Uncharacterized protein n=1 Tax=Dreissena polymorpha TaxID=45954 RepID=A0A9D4RVY9_DREPO|nr:hypothetical protein DPMN_004765 [Dreissena polymorpha]